MERFILTSWTFCRLLFAFAFTFFFFVSGAGGAEAGLPGVRAVNFYPQGTKFIFAVEPDPATHEFQAELPGAFQPGSVRLLNPGDADNLKVVQGTRENWVPPALAGLREQTDTQAQTVSLLTARGAALEQSRSLLKSVTPKEAGASDLLAYIKEAQELKLQVENELTALNEKLAAEKKTLSRLRQELRTRSPASAGSFIQVSGHTAGGSGGPVLIEAFSDAAVWYPRYTMDLDSVTGAIQTRMYARAVQRTGLDYSGPLTFHTKDPDETVTSPMVYPLRVELKPKVSAQANYHALPESAPVPRAMKSMSKEQELPFSMEDAEEMDEMETEEEAALAPVMEATLSDRVVSGQGTLTGDGREADFMLGELQLDGKVLLISIPEQRSSAWIVVSMDTAPVSLIPGNAELLVDGQPAGSTYLPEYGLGQARIPFGYAPLITSRKEPLVEKTGSSWFSGSLFAGGYTLEITNGMKEDRTVVVRDRLPVPTNDKITLDVKRIEPAPKERDKENRLTWELSVKAGGTVKIIVDYALSYPSGEELQYR